METNIKTAEELIKEVRAIWNNPHPFFSKEDKEQLIGNLLKKFYETNRKEYKRYEKIKEEMGGKVI